MMNHETAKVSRRGTFRLRNLFMTDKCIPITGAWLEKKANAQKNCKQFDEKKSGKYGKFSLSLFSDCVTGGFQVIVDSEEKQCFTL